MAAPRREVAAFVRDHAAERGADALPGLVLFTEHWLAEARLLPALCHSRIPSRLRYIFMVAAFLHALARNVAIRRRSFAPKQRPDTRLR